MARLGAALTHRRSGRRRAIGTLRVCVFFSGCKARSGHVHVALQLMRAENIVAALCGEALRVQTPAVFVLSGITRFTHHARAIAGAARRGGFAFIGSANAPTLTRARVKRAAEKTCVTGRTAAICTACGLRAHILTRFTLRARGTLSVALRAGALQLELCVITLSEHAAAARIGLLTECSGWAGSAALIRDARVEQRDVCARGAAAGGDASRLGILICVVFVYAAQGHRRCSAWAITARGTRAAVGACATRRTWTGIYRCIGGGGGRRSIAACIFGRDTVLDFPSRTAPREREREECCVMSVSRWRVLHGVSRKAHRTCEHRHAYTGTGLLSADPRHF
jgi:hypothetical protein